MGNKQNYQHITADDAEQEEILRAEGWKDYGDLPEYTETVPLPIDPSTAVDYEQFDFKVKELETAQSEIEHLNNVIAEGMAENKELRNQLRFKELEDMHADELKAMLDAAGVKYKANDGKPVLAQAVLDYENSQVAE